jgi:hypothetical protein
MRRVRSYGRSARQSGGGAFPNTIRNGGG